MTEKNEKVTEKNEIAEPNKFNYLVSVDSFEEDAGSGLENIKSDDLTIPRLKILQALSPEVNKSNGKYVEGAAAGDLLNTVTKELYTENKECLAVPVTYKRMFLEWQPREDGGGLIKQHTDPGILSETKRDKKGADVLSNGNYIQTTATHYCLIADGDSYQQVMIPMAGTQLKRSRTWNSVMAGLKVKSSTGKVFTPPTYSHKYKLTTVSESNDRGTWFGWNIEQAGVLKDEEWFLYEAAKEFSSTISFENSLGSSEQDSDVPF